MKNDIKLHKEDLPANLKLGSSFIGDCLLKSFPIFSALSKLIGITIPLLRLYSLILQTQSSHLFS